MYCLYRDREMVKEREGERVVKLLTAYIYIYTYMYEQ